MVKGMTLDEAIQGFLVEGTYDNEWAMQDGTPGRLPVSELTDPDRAMGVCELVSAEFVEYLKMRGFHTATVVVTDEATEWGYQGTTRHGMPCQHAGGHMAVEVDGVFIDWTASQYIGTREPFPLIGRPNDQRE